MLLLVTFVICFTSVLKHFLYYQKKMITSMKIKEKMKNIVNFQKQVQLNKN